jgi:hypothetical protein
MSEKKKINFKNVRLEYKDVCGQGKQIFATLGREFNCVEFVKKADHAQPVLLPNRNQLGNKERLIGYEQWIQFKPKEWNEAIDEIFTEIVKLWNKKYGRVTNDEIESKLESIIKRWSEKADDLEHSPNKESKKAYLDCARTLQMFIQYLKYGCPKFE